MTSAWSSTCWPVKTLLQHCGLPIMEARALLSHASGHSREHLIAHDDAPLDARIVAAFAALTERRRNGEPLAYLTGLREFFGRSFRVTPAVLIPRPETELLCEQALIRLSGGASRVLDLGTGSGAIAITLALEQANARVTATDISRAALDLARENAQGLNADVRFAYGSWYAAVPGETFDLIVSNPPYVAASDPHLEAGDLRFEPRSALTDQSDGLASIRLIVNGAHPHLAAGGWILIEHGYDQATTVRALLAQAGFIEVQSISDLAGIERVTLGRHL